MKLLIKQRVFAWGDTYDVYDEDGRTKYCVRAEVFTLGHQIHIFDMNKREIGAIHQRVFTFRPKFDIEINNRIIGTIEKEFTLLRPKYFVDLNGWRIEGNVWGWDYEVKSGEHRIAHISKEPLHWGDTYVLHIAEEKDEIMVLMLVLAIDAVNCSQYNN